MYGYRVLARSFVYIYILILLSPGAYAQEIPGRIANTGLTGVSSMQAPQNMFDGTRDILFGKSANGPYTLSWKPVDRNSESITINNHRVERNVDYQIDYASGVLTFTKPVPNGAVIEVEYKYDPKKATRNVSAVSLPLTLDLLRKQNNSLQFTALYKQAGADPKQTSDLMILGLTGNTKLESGEIKSMFLFTPDAPGQDAADASFIDRAAVQLGGSTDIGGLSLTTSYSRIGEHFTGAKEYKEYKLKPGAEIMDLGAVYSISESLKLNASTKRTEELAGAKEGEVTTTNTYAVAFNDKDAPKLNVSRTEMAKERPDADGTKTTTDSVKLEHQLSAKLSASATHENVLTETGSDESRTTTNELKVSAKPSDTVTVDTKLTQKDSTEIGSQINANMDVNVRQSPSSAPYKSIAGVDIDKDPSKVLNVKAGVTSLNHDEGGKDTGEMVSVSARPTTALRVDVSAARRNTEENGSDATESMKLTAKPSARFSLEMDIAHRDSEVEGSEFGHAIKVASKPLSYLDVKMDWSDRESEIRGNEQVGNLQLQANPHKMVTLSAAFGLRGTDDTQNLTKETRLTLKPFDHTTIAGGYRELESDGMIVSKVTDVSAATKPSKFIEVSAGYKQRETIGQEDLNSVNVGVVLDSGGLVKLTGDYSVNPEDKQGVVLRENSRKVGLLTDFGKLKVKGGFAMKDNYLVGKRSEVTEVGVDYRLSAHSSVTTSYKLDEYREASLLTTNVYGIGYKHQVGSDFNLYLGGTLTTYEQDRMYLEGKTEYEAQASLGLRF